MRFGGQNSKDWLPENLTISEVKPLADHQGLCKKKDWLKPFSFLIDSQMADLHQE